MNRNGVACSILTALVFAIGMAPQAQALEEEDYKQMRKLWDESANDEGSSKVKARSSIYAYVIGKVYSRNASPFVDLNADGKLEVVVGRWTGGAHCCTDYQVYSLGTPSKPWKRIDGRDGSFYFADLDGDKKYETIGADFTFA